MILGFSLGAGEAKGRPAFRSQERHTWPEELQGPLEESRDSGTDCRSYTLERQGVSTNNSKKFLNIFAFIMSLL